jgi:hypothetical protein
LPCLACGRRAPENDLEFGEFTGLSIYLNRADMLLDDNVVAVARLCVVGSLRVICPRFAIEVRSGPARL